MDARVVMSPDHPIEARGRAPRPWQEFTERFPAIVAAYDDLRGACDDAGPLEDATVALVKLAVSVGAGRERTVHAHARKALRKGVDPSALRQVVLIALPTIGLPAALDALRWVDESIREAAGP
jgi:AhpD family alkylhydroperoxidase